MDIMLLGKETRLYLHIHFYKKCSIICLLFMSIE